MSSYAPTTISSQAAANRLLNGIEYRGGAVQAVEWMQSRIEESAYRAARGIEEGSTTVVGVNRYRDDDSPQPAVSRTDPALEETQRDRLALHRAERDQVAVDGALQNLGLTARGNDNLMRPMREALAAGATVGEVSGALREVFGVHRPGS